jgi:hypothetical protein
MSGWAGLGVLGVVAGLVAGVAEALGTFFFVSSPPPLHACVLFGVRAC